MTFAAERELAEVCDLIRREIDDIEPAFIERFRSRTVESQPENAMVVGHATEVLVGLSALRIKWEADDCNQLLVVGQAYSKAARSLDPSDDVLAERAHMAYEEWAAEQRVLRAKLDVIIELQVDAEVDRLIDRFCLDVDRLHFSGTEFYTVPSEPDGDKCE